MSFWNPIFACTAACCIAVPAFGAVDAGGSADAVTVGNRQMELSVGLSHGLPRISYLGLRQSESGLAARPVTTIPETPLAWSAEIDGKRVGVNWRYVKMLPNNKRDKLVVTYATDQPKLELVSTWSFPLSSGPAEHDVTILNKSDKTIILAPPPTIDLRFTAKKGNALEHWWVDKTAGHASEVGVHTDPLIPGYEKTLLCGPYSQTNETRDEFPWFCLHDKTSGTGVYGGIEFSGWTEILVRSESDGSVTVSMGLKPDGGKTRTRLAPGGELRLPTCFIGAYKGDVEDGTNQLHRWVESHLRPPIPGKVTPLLVNNSWGSGMAIDEPLAKRMIDESAELGIEMFHVDAGWFKQVGDWNSHPQKLPNGLEKIADYTHEKGLKFGLWVGWTQGGALKQFGPDVLTPFNPEQKDWFAHDFPPDWKNAIFSGATVCLGSAEARNWCLNDLRRMVKQYKLDLLEHDQDMILQGCSREGHGHIPNDRVDTSRAACEGYYWVYDQLRKENPNLLFEDCVNGGRLFDFGVAKRAHYICMSDDFAPLPLRKDFYDSSYPFPPSMLEEYIANHAGETVASLKYMLRSTMLGWCTIMCDTSKWTPDQHDAAKKEFATYKQRLRPLIASANIYHVLPRPDDKTWDGMQYIDPKTSKGVLYVFRPESELDSQVVKLKGLNPKKKYAIDAIDGSANGTFTGEELMTKGLQVELPEQKSSDLVFFAAVK